MRAVLLTLLALAACARAQDLYPPCAQYNLTGTNALADSGTGCRSLSDTRKDGSTCQLSCPLGFVRVEAGQPNQQTIKCDTGVWVGAISGNPVPFSCKPIDCGAASSNIPANSALTATCVSTYTFPGTPCSFKCNAGYELAGGPNYMFCNVDGKWSSVGTCVDVNSCLRSPCNTVRSTCQDLNPGQEAEQGIGHRCICKDGYFGTPGFDGEGCQRLQVSSHSTGMRFSVGQGQDISFKFGSFSTGAGKLASLIQQMTAPLGAVTVAQANVTRFRTVAMVQAENDIDDAMVGEARVAQKLAGQSASLVSVLGANLNGAASLATMEPSSLSASTLANTLSTGVASRLTATNADVDFTSNMLASTVTSGVSILSAQSSAIFAMDKLLTQIYKDHNAVESNINVIIPTLGDSVTLAVNNASKSSIQRQAVISTQVAAVNSQVVNVTVTNPQLEYSYLTVSNTREYIKCRNLFGYQFINGTCIKILKMVGFNAAVSSTSNGYVGNQQGNFVALATQASQYPFDGANYNHATATYKVTTAGLYLLTSSIGSYMAGTNYGYTPFYVGIGINGNKPDFSNGLITTRAYPHFYYDTGHMQAVLKLSVNDQVTEYCRSDGNPNAYRFYAGWAMALINDVPNAPGFLAAGPLPRDFSVSTNTWITIDKPWATSGVDTLYNVNNLFNTNTGCFTVPVDGLYTVSGAVTVRDHSVSLFKLGLMVDGASTEAFVTVSSNLYSNAFFGDSIDTSGVLSLKADQKVCLGVMATDSTFTLMNTSFSAGLLKQASRPHFVATYPSGGQQMTTYYTYINNLATACKFCVSHPAFSAGLFTVPATGSYYIDIIMNMQNMDTYYGYLYLQVNGNGYSTSTMWMFQSGNVRTYTNLHMSNIVRLSQGDRVQLYYYSSTDYSWIIMQETTWSMTMITVT